MRFVTNRISTGKAKSFEDIIKEYQKSKEVKVASSTATVKTAEQDEADSSGQLDVEPLHQEGESTTMPKAGPSAKKDDGGKAAEAAADTDPEKEGKDSGQPKAEGSEKFTNNPEVPSKEEKGGSSGANAKVARNQDGTGPEGKGPRTGRGYGICNSDPGEYEDGEKSTQEKGKLPKALEEHKFTKKEDKDKKDEEKKESEVKDKEDEEKKESEVKDEDEEKKESEVKDEDKKEEEDEEKKEASSVKFVKIANLNAKNKGFLREYWTKLYGEDYVSALLADK